MIPSNYVDKCINIPVSLRVCRYWDEKQKQMIFCRINRVTEETMKKKIMMYPTGQFDDDGVAIYAGDLLEVEIEAKGKTFQRKGVVRTEGLYAAGIDYLDKDGNLTDDGDFIDEFYISSKKIIGNVFSGENRICITAEG